MMLTITEGESISDRIISQVNLGGIQFLDSQYTVTKIPRYSVLLQYSGWGYGVIIKAAMAPRMYTWQRLLAEPQSILSEYRNTD